MSATPTTSVGRTATADPKPENLYAAAYRDFVEQTRDHHLVVLHDDGRYRHLRVQAPGTRMWSWDVTTWPGHLATSGDIADGHIFTREPDMLAFFARAGRSDENYYSDGAPSIDVRYWAEKLCGGRSHEVKVYDPDYFLQLVREHLEQHEDLGDEAQDFHERQLALLDLLHGMRGLDAETRTDLFEAHWTAESAGASCHQFSALRDLNNRAASQSALAGLWGTDGLTDDQLDELITEHHWHELADSEITRQSPAERREEILEDARWHADSESEAHKWLQENEEHVGSDTWEWDLREYDLHFLFTCYAIALTTKLWFEHLATQPTDTPNSPKDQKAA